MPPQDPGPFAAILPDSPSLARLSGQAKSLLKAHRAGDATAVARVHTSHPRFSSADDRDAVAAATLTLRDAQLVVAREYGFDNWTELKRHVEVAVGGQIAATIEALSQAARRGDLATLRTLLDRHPELIDERGGPGERPPLLWAAYNGHGDVVEALLGRGADTGVRCVGDRATALHFAAERPRLEIMRQLLAAGADPVGADDYHGMGVIGWAAAMQASPEAPEVAFAERAQAVELLLSHGASHTLWSAMAMGALEFVRAAVAADRGILQRPGRLHRTYPLHQAAAGTGRPHSPPQLEVVALLIELGAPLDTSNEQGYTPLDLAALGGAREIAQALLDAGARMSLPAAVGLQSPELPQLLRQHRSELKRGGRYDTLIEHAASHGSAAQVKALLTAGADVHGRYPDDDFSTPLHLAAMAGKRDVAEVLLQFGADPTLRDTSYNSTPAGTARYAGHGDLADWREGASPEEGRP